MKLFKSTNGFVFSFGFDMINRRPDPNIICWDDGTSTGRWGYSASSQAGYHRTDYMVNPEFVMESNGVIVAYQPGMMIEMIYIGTPLVWSFRISTPS